MDVEARRSPEVPSQWPRKVLLAEPRGFCAGVARSVEAYKALLTDADQVRYSVGEPAHNTHVNNEFRNMGVVFVDDVTHVPEGSIAALGPHGSTPEDLAVAQRKRLTIVDTECPLVKKVHKETERYLNQGRTILYYGKKGHMESRGILGEEAKYRKESGEGAPGRILLFESKDELLQILEEQGENIDPQRLAFITQTTHAAKTAEEIMNMLKQKYPDIAVPDKQDICYATQNRQDGVKAIVGEGAEAVVVVGSPHSSNSKELSTVAKEAGARIVFFVDSVQELSLFKDAFHGINCVGITSGASVPEHIVEEVVEWFRSNGSDQFGTVSVADERRIKFAPPKVQKL